MGSSVVWHRAHYTNILFFIEKMNETQLGRGIFKNEFSISS